MGRRLGLSLSRKLLFLLHTSVHFLILENKDIGHVDDSTLIAVVPSSVVRVAIAESPNHFVGQISYWCDL